MRVAAMSNAVTIISRRPWRLCTWIGLAIALTCDRILPGKLWSALRSDSVVVRALPRWRVLSSSGTRTATS